jgi:hypothetical protein
MNEMELIKRAVALFPRKEYIRASDTLHVRMGYVEAVRYLSTSLKWKHLWELKA